MTAARVACGKVLPAGTRVRKLGCRPVRLGTVMPCEPHHSWAGVSFPVRFDDGTWEILDSAVVMALTQGGRS